jgi:hypothetical protein
LLSASLSLKNKLFSSSSSKIRTVHHFGPAYLPPLCTLRKTPCLKQIQTIKLFFPDFGLEEAQFSRTRFGNPLLFDTAGAKIQPNIFYVLLQ